MSTFYPENDYRTYLTHHGVKGMKWGVRKQYRADKKRRFQLGKSATIADHSLTISNQQLDRLNKKIEKHGPKERYLKELDRQKWVNKNLKKKRNAYKSALNKQVKKMQKAYGTKVKDIHYNKKGEISERVISGKDVLLSGLLTAGSLATANAINAPFFMAMYPNSVKAKSSDYTDMYWDSIREKDREIATKRIYEELNNLKKEK